MKKWIAVSLVALMLTACGSSQKQVDQEDDGAYTQDDLERETSDVYRPSNPGEDDDGVEKGSKPEKSRDATVENTSDPKTEPTSEPKKETPREAPKETPRTEPKSEPKKESDPTVEEPKKDTTPKSEPKKVDADARRDLMTQFIRSVNDDMNALEKSKGWKEFLKAKEKFTDRLDKALEKGNDERGKSAESAWAEAIKAWYEVRFAREAFMHVNRNSGSDFEPGAGLNYEELEAYTTEQLSSEACMRTTAAYELTEPEMKDVRKFQTDVLKYDLVAGKVFQDEDYAKKWKDEKQKWQDATNGEFDDKDLKKYR
ncbi:MAG: hypothetical protein KDB32_11570 [Planctomycetes bacterium]|nr:hypothetical protein [Planctomycetota bacterium]